MRERRELVERVAAALAPVAFGSAEVWNSPHLRRIRDRLMRDALRRARALIRMVRSFG